MIQSQGFRVGTFNAVFVEKGTGQRGVWGSNSSVKDIGGSMSSPSHAGFREIPHCEALVPPGTLLLFGNGGHL